MYIERISPFVKIQKEKKLQEMRNLMEGTADGLGKGLDKGMIETCTLLNVLGYHTQQSCDGHGDHCAWVTFKTPTEEIEDSNPNSIYWQVKNNARDMADKKVLEKFGEEYINSLETWTDELSDYWSKVYVETRDSDPHHQEYEVTVAKIREEMLDIGKRSTELKNEFLDSIGEPRNSIFSDDRRIEFMSEQEYENETLTKEMIERSNELLKKFEVFLKEKYLRS